MKRWMILLLAALLVCNLSAAYATEPQIVQLDANRWWFHTNENITMEDGAVICDPNLILNTKRGYLDISISIKFSLADRAIDYIGSWDVYLNGEYFANAWMISKFDFGETAQVNYTFDEPYAGDENSIQLLEIVPVYADRRATDEKYHAYPRQGNRESTVRADDDKTTEITLPEGVRRFDLARTEDGTNILRCYAVDGEATTLLFETTAGIPQTENELRIFAGQGVTDRATWEDFDVPALTISQLDEDAEITEREIDYRYMGADTWTLLQIWTYSEFGCLQIEDGNVLIWADVENIDPDNPTLTEPLAFDPNLRTLDLQAFTDWVNELVEPYRDSDEDMDLHG